MMKKITLLFSLLISFGSFAQSDLIITGVVDGPLSGGTPKAVELYVVNDIADLSLYGVGSANNGGGTDGVEFTFPMVPATAGDYIYVDNGALNDDPDDPDATGNSFFEDFFGFPADYSDGALGVNGDDAIELFLNDAAIDVFGDINVDGTGETWDYIDGWAYRINGMMASTTFNDTDWTYSNPNALDGETANNTATTPFPIGTYSPMANNEPTLFVGQDVNGLFYFEGNYNAMSAEDMTTVRGTNLAEDITVTAPENFEVSLTTGSGFANSITVSQTGGEADITDVFVRLVDGLAEGNYTGNVSVTSSGAMAQNIATEGTVAAAGPMVDINSGDIDDLNYQVDNGPSDEDSFTVDGMFLESDITVTAPMNFEVSLTSGSAFATSVTITPTMGTVEETEVFVRLAASLDEGPYSGTLTASAMNANDDTITLNGNVTPNVNCPGVGAIIISEFMPNPAVVADNEGEYFEVYNTTTTDIDMNGWTVSDNGSNSFLVNQSVVVPANGYALFAINGDTNTNGGLPTVDFDYNGMMALANGDDEIILTCGGTIIDQVFYTGGDFPYQSGVSAELSSDNLNSTDNDTGSNWGAATTPYGDGSNMGTPGAANDFVLSADEFGGNSFKMFPNPTANGSLTITTANTTDASVTIFSILGKQVVSQKLTGNSLNVSELQSGIYLVKVTQSGATSTQKLIVR